MTKFQWLTESIAAHSSDDCLLWSFYVDDEGYGALSYKGKRVLAHRLAFYLSNGHWPTPEGCHSCDNPTCFNPRHIFEGTHKENHEDASRKLRRGTKLTPDLVIAIRREYAPRPGSGLRSLAKKYGVTHNCIKEICAKRTWAFI